MALIPNISKDSISSDCTTIVLNDLTANYAAANTGGYRGELLISSIATMSGSALVISFSVNGVSKTLTEGIDWAVGGSIDATCDNIVTAINLIAGVSAVKEGTTKILIYPDATFVLTALSLSSILVGMTIYLQYRDKLAIKLFVMLQKSTGYEVITLPDYDPLTVTSWTITIGEDGYYIYYAIVCPIYIAGTWVLDNIVYDEDEEAFYKCIVASTTNGTGHADWEEITAKEDFEEGNNVYQDSDDETIICFSNICLARANLKFIDKGSCNPTEKKKYEELRNKVEGAIYAAAEGNHTRAQTIIEDVSLKCEDLNCGC